MDTNVHSLRPLPEDIQKMTEAETACQYCGISYLLLTKYEKMTMHVQQLEKQLQELQVTFILWIQS
jgi:hypothetical protein